MRMIEGPRQVLLQKRIHVFGECFNMALNFEVISKLSANSIKGENSLEFSFKISINTVC